MKRLFRVCTILIVSFIPFICKAQQRDFIVVTDYVTADGSVDLSDELQEIIDSNPNRTIYFPDGIYRIDKPILTPASPDKSVALSLSNYAIIKAGPDWSGDRNRLTLK